MKNLTIIILLLIGLKANCQQKVREKDTVKAVLLICDTLQPSYVSTYMTFDSLTSTGWVGVIKTDTSYLDYSYQVQWRFGYEVLEKHNSGENLIDPYHCITYDENGNRISCYNDYWVSLKYLNEYKEEFSDNIIIWQSIPENK